MKITISCDVCRAAWMSQPTRALTGVFEAFGASPWLVRTLIWLATSSTAYLSFPPRAWHSRKMTALWIWSVDLRFPRGIQRVNSVSLVSSAHLRAVANGSLWTLTCAHTCVFTLETARMCAPLMAATKNLPSQPTWSLTSSHTPKPKTTSESVLNPAHDDNFTEKWLFLNLFDTHTEVWTRNLCEPRPPQASYPTLALPGWNDVWILLVKMLNHGSVCT